MAEIKTKANNTSVIDFINGVSDEQKRKDAHTLLAIFKEITKEKPMMWGTSIIGFGKYHYKSERSSQEGDWPLTGFSPRKQALTLYMMSGFAKTEPLLKELGKHSTTSGSCLYIKKLDDVNMAVLKKLITFSYREAKKKFT